MIKVSMKVRVAAVLAMFLAAVVSGQANIHLTVYTDVKEFVLSGSDAGTPQNVSGWSAFEWSSAGYAGGVGTSTQVESALTSSNSTVNTAWVFLVNNDGQVSFYLRLSSLAATTITANDSIRLSYADYTLDQQTALENLAINQRTLNPSHGTGTSAVTTSAVPEPSTWALGGLGILLAVWAYARRRSLAA